MTESNSCFVAECEGSEVTRVFHDYKLALRARGYCALRFKTPMQRALSLSKKAAALAVSKQRQLQETCTLLPPGPTTESNVDVISLLALLQKPYQVTIPLSLISNSGLVMTLGNHRDGLTRIRSYADIKSALEDFLQEAGNSTSPPIQFAYKITGQSSVFIPDISEAKFQLFSNIDKPQCLQVFLTPYPRRTAYLRVQWLSSRSRNVYFVKVKSGANFLGKPPCLAKSLPYLSRSFSTTPSLTTSSNIAPTRLNPILEIDTAMNEFTRAISDSQKGIKVKELVCDFLLDKRQRWVLVNCLGYSFSSHRQVKSEVIAPKISIDLKFIFMPLLAQNDEFRVSVKQKSLNQTIGKIEPVDESSQVVIKQPTPIKTRKASKSQYQLPFFNKTVTKFDEICANAQRLKKHESIDFVLKYGLKVWKPVVQRLTTDLVKEKYGCKETLESFSEEQVSMIQRGFLRIIQGDYNFYYVAALKRIHIQLCITQRLYDSFLATLSAMMADTPVTAVEADTVLRRFRELRCSICVNSPSP